MNTYPSQVIFTKSIRYAMRYGDIEWAIKFQITTKGTTAKVSSRPKYIKKFIRENLGSKMGLLRKIIKKPHHTTNMPCHIKYNESQPKLSD